MKSQWTHTKLVIIFSRFLGSVPREGVIKDADPREDVPVEYLRVSGVQNALADELTENVGKLVGAAKTPVAALKVKIRVVGM